VEIGAEAKEARDGAALLDALAAVRAAKNDPNFDALSEYRRVFEEHGLRIATESEGFARLRRRPRPFIVRLASFLDDWSLLLVAGQGSQEEVARLAALADAVDPDPWRKNLRAALLKPGLLERKAAVSRQASVAEMAAQPAPTVALLGLSLLSLNEPQS